MNMFSISMNNSGVQVTLTLHVIVLQGLEDRNLLSGYVAMFLEDYNTAQVGAALGSFTVWLSFTLIRFSLLVSGLVSVVFTTISCS